MRNHFTKFSRLMSPLLIHKKALFWDTDAGNDTGSQRKQQSLKPGMAHTSGNYAWKLNWEAGFSARWVLLQHPIQASSLLLEMKLWDFLVHGNCLFSVHVCRPWSLIFPNPFSPVAPSSYPLDLLSWSHLSYSFSPELLIPSLRNVRFFCSSPSDQ